MCLLVRSLLALTALDTIVQEVHPLLVLLLELSFYTLILHVLELVHSLVCVLVPSCPGKGILSVAVFRELQVVLVKNHLLNVVGRLVANEQVLGSAILIALNDLVFEAQELQNLLEHCGHDRPLRS